MNNKESLTELLAYANKYMNSQYECNIVLGEASYKNIDLLIVYRINELYQSKRINEEERNRLLNLHYKKIVLEQKLDDAKTEKEQEEIEKKLAKILEDLIPYGLNEEISIETLISNTNNYPRKLMDTNLLTALILISDKLRNEYNLSALEAAECINSYGDILYINESAENIEYFLHTDLNTWAKLMYENYKGKSRNLTKNDK